MKIDFTARRIHSLLSFKTLTDSEEGLNIVMTVTANDYNFGNLTANDYFLFVAIKINVTVHA